MKDRDIIRLISTDEAMGILELKNKYGSTFRQICKDVFDTNVDLIEMALDSFYSKVRENFRYRGNVALVTYFNAQLRNEIVALLLQREDLLYFPNISDIAVRYSKEYNNFSSNGADFLKVDLILPELGKKEVEFFVRRYYYLHHKEKVMQAMNLTEEKFEKIKDRIEEYFGCSDVRLAELARGIGLQCLEEYNKIVYSSDIYKASDFTVHVSTEQEIRSERMNKRFLFWSAFTAFMFFIGILLKLIFK